MNVSIAAKPIGTTYNVVHRKKTNWHNPNKLIKGVDGVIGLKIGSMDTKRTLIDDFKAVCVAATFIKFNVKVECANALLLYKEFASAAYAERGKRTDLYMYK